MINAFSKSGGAGCGRRGGGKVRGVGRVPLGVEREAFSSCSPASGDKVPVQVPVEKVSSRLG